jgi:hypothetical protein
MPNYKEQKAIKEIANTLRILADLMEKNPIIASEVLKELSTRSVAQSPRKSDSLLGKKPEMDSSPDVFAILLEKGAEQLRDELQAYEIETLKQIVSYNHLDTAGKVRKWRSKAKIVEFIMGAVDKRISQGDAFRSAD